MFITFVAFEHNIDDNQSFMWGNGYDQEKYDGFFIFRRFNKIDLGENTELNFYLHYKVC